MMKTFAWSEGRFDEVLILRCTSYRNPNLGDSHHHSNGVNKPHPNAHQLRVEYRTVNAT